MDFDNITFDGGLNRVGRLIKVQWGVDVYGITAYTDLDGLLDNKWFIHCFNSNGDFGYVIMKTNFPAQEKETTC